MQMAKPFLSYAKKGHLSGNWQQAPQRLQAPVRPGKMGKNDVKKRIPLAVQVFCDTNLVELFDIMLKIYQILHFRQ